MCIYIICTWKEISYENRIVFSFLALNIFKVVKIGEEVNAVRGRAGQLKARPAGSSPSIPAVTSTEKEIRSWAERP